MTNKPKPGDVYRRCDDTCHQNLYNIRWGTKKMFACVMNISWNRPVL